jgi:hypothetical protein
MTIENDIDLSGNPRLAEFDAALAALLEEYCCTLDKEGVIKLLQHQADLVKFDDDWKPFDPNAEPPAP